MYPFPSLQVHLPASPSYPSSSRQGVGGWQEVRSPLPFGFQPLPGQREQPLPLNNSMETASSWQDPKNPALQMHSFPSPLVMAEGLDAAEAPSPCPRIGTSLRGQSRNRVTQDILVRLRTGWCEGKKKEEISCSTYKHTLRFLEVYCEAH